MNSNSLAITGTGLVTGVGLDTASSCAAIRAAIDNFEETRFMDAGGEWILGCEVPLEQPWRGTRKLAKMLAMALTECAETSDIKLVDVPVILCVAEQERPGRIDDLGEQVFQETEQELGVKFSYKFNIVEHGRVGGLVALRRARDWIRQGTAPQVIVAGVDSLLSAKVIREYEERDRILTRENSDGFIPGEAASAILVEAPKANNRPQFLCTGIGFGVEQATIDSEEPLKAEGISAAIREAFQEAKTDMDNMDFRIVDVSGEQYWFKESALVVAKFLRVHKEGFPLWHIADCVGEVGAAVFGASTAYAKISYDKAFDDGANMLQHYSNNDGKRGAAVFRHAVVT